MHTPSEPPTRKKPRFNPWLFLIAAFLLLISAWTTLIVIAIRHSPERIGIVRPAR